MPSRAARLAFLLALAGSAVLAGPASGAPSTGSSGSISGSVSSTKRQPVVHRFVTVDASAAVRLRLTPLTRTRYAGREIQWSCALAGTRPSSGGIATISRSTGALRVGRTGDYCLVEVVIRAVRKSRRFLGSTVDFVRQLVQPVALSPTGRAYISRVWGASAVSLAADLALAKYDPAARTLPAASALVREHPLLVELGGADVAAPVGRAGVWTGGSRVHAAYGMADGTQLYFNRDEVTRAVESNVLDELAMLDEARRQTGAPTWFDTWTESTRGGGEYGEGR